MKRRSEGFTLIEVMVAVAILALALGAIFSSEAGAAKAAYRSRKIGFATLGARCKMNEIEEQVAKEGFPAVFDQGSDNCCKEAPIEGITCTWEIEPITLPDTMFAPEDGSDDKDKNKPGGDKKNSPLASGAKDTGAKGLLESLPGLTGKDPKTGAPGGGTDPMQALKSVDPSQILAGGGIGGMAAMALSYAYPVLKPGFEGQIRRATVTVHWFEGSNDHSFDVTQYLVAERPPPIDPNAANLLQQQQQLSPQQGGIPAGKGTPSLGGPSNFGSGATFQSPGKF